MLNRSSLRPSHAIALVVLASLTACNSVAQKYVVAPSNTLKLRKAGMENVKVGIIEAKNSSVNDLTIRGGSYVSPYNGSYADYLKEALTAELGEAGLLDAASFLELSGVLVKNDLDASGFSTAYAEIEARFVVKQQGQVRFEKTLSAKYEWESAFPGMVAIARAQQNYPTVIQQLVAKLFSDPDFIAAVKKS